MSEEEKKVLFDSLETIMTGQEKCGGYVNKPDAPLKEKP